MRRRARPLAAPLAWALVGALALGGCSTPVREVGATDRGRTEIPADFPLSSGMGGPAGRVATVRSGTGLRDLTLCRTAPLRGLGLRDRLVADDSGGRSAYTRELVLLGSSAEAARVASAFGELASGCGSRGGRNEAPTSGPGRTRTLTEARPSPFGPAPATVLVQTYSVDGEPGEGATVIHVVPLGAALLVASTYGRWTRAQLEDGVASTVGPLRQVASALEIFEEGAEGASEGHSSVEDSLASPGGRADEVTETTEENAPAMCVITRTGC